jgi:hypothetical protein
LWKRKGFYRTAVSPAPTDDVALRRLPGPILGMRDDEPKMTSAQYRRALEALGLTQESAAQFLGVSIRTSHGYANGQPIREGDALALQYRIALEKILGDPPSTLDEPDMDYEVIAKYREIARKALKLKPADV